VLEECLFGGRTFTAAAERLAAALLKAHSCNAHGVHLLTDDNSNMTCSSKQKTASGSRVPTGSTVLLLLLLLLCKSAAALLHQAEQLLA
jgi:hypothetical protein